MMAFLVFIMDYISNKAFSSMISSSVFACGKSTFSAGEGFEKNGTRFWKNNVL